MFEPVAEFVVDFAGDFAASCSEVVVAGCGFIDEDEAGFVVYTDAVEKFAFETGLFDEPARIDLVAIFTAMNRVAFGFGGLGGGIV